MCKYQVKHKLYYIFTKASKFKENVAFTSFAMYAKIGAQLIFAWQQIWVNGIKCGICSRFAVYLLYCKNTLFRPVIVVD